MLNKIIELFSHNEEAYESLVNSLKEYPLAFIEHATGTGKSFIILKYLYNFMRHKRILFVTKHDEMFDQLFGPQMHTLGIDRKDFKQFDTMIYHNIIKYDMKKLAEKYDCIIFDEAHHCGAKEWGKKVLELKDLILKSKDKVMIGLTATGIRYLDDYMDVSEVFFDGHVVSRLPVSKAILKELLPAPLYINSLRACQNKLNKVLNKLNKVPRNNDTISLNEEVMDLNNQIERQSSVGNLLKKYGVKEGEKYIVFCSSIKDLESKMKEAEDWFSDIGKVKMFQAHSSQKKAINRKEINEFSENRPEVSLMFAVDIFNEGFHIDNVDGVLMFRKTQSPIIYLQQLGRALAFSLRRKQIKIFDFVDNISDNDVVRELYKEIVSVARKMIEEEPDKREFYENILKRFEIVDYTTNVMQRLEEIEKHLDETYTYRNSISIAIMKLKEYREKHPEGDIVKDINRHQINYEYIKAYNYLINADDYLTLANIEELQKLNINFDNKIITDVNIRKRLLKGFDNFLELKNHELDTFVKDYINFYEEHNRRPSSSNNKEENILYELYRSYLTSLGKNKLSHILNSFPFKLTVEEIILTGSYPIKEEIDDYLCYLCEKVKYNQTLDKVEVRVLKRLRNTIPMNYYELINYLDQKNDLGDVITNAIKIFEKYKTIANNQSVVGLYNWEIKRAFNVITKYAKYVTNEQFLKLLELKVQLPESLNMSYEKRLELLEGYDSFYAHELALETGIITEYFNFIIKHNRRPQNTINEEMDLAKRYDDYIVKTNVSKLKTICSSLDNYGVPKTLYERAIIGEEIDEVEINQYVRTMIRKFRSGLNFTKGELRLLTSLVNKQHFTSLQETIDILDIVQVFNTFEELFDNYQKLQNEETKRKLICFVRNNNDYISKKMLDKLSSIGCPLPEELQKEINNLSLYVCLKDKKLNDRRLLVEEFNDYIRTKKTRPDRYSELNKLYRRYLSTLYKKQLRNFLSILEENNIAYTFEEKALLDIIDRKEVESYLNKVRSSIRFNQEIDTLTRRVLRILMKNKYLSHEDELAKYISKDVGVSTLKGRVLGELLHKVKDNPYRPIDIDKYSMSVSYKEIEEIDNLRRNMIYKNLFYSLLSRLHETKETVEDVLNDEENNLFNEALSYGCLDEENKILLKKIREKNVDNIFLKMKTDRKLFINKYIEFINNNRGLRPNRNSESEEEVNLADQFEKVKDILSNQELELIDSTLKNALSVYEEENFYDSYINFIMDMKRFPCGNSDNPNEVRLNNLYLTLNKNLNPEQDKEVKRLKKIYARSTMQATIEFNKKKNT